MTREQLQDLLKQALTVLDYGDSRGVVSGLTGRFVVSSDSEELSFFINYMAVVPTLQYIGRGSELLRWLSLRLLEYDVHVTTLRSLFTVAPFYELNGFRLVRKVDAKSGLYRKVDGRRLYARTKGTH